MDEVPAEHKVVFHYTSMDAMMKIVESKSLWCTAIPYLNDSSEREFLMGKVRERIPKLERDQPALFEGLHIDLGAARTQPPLTPLSDEQFVTSFSAKGDSLMHWRSYCPQQSGVAIGFRTQCLGLATIAEKPQRGMLVPEIAFGRVVYLDADATETIDHIVIDALSGTRDWVQRQSKEHPGVPFSANDYFRWLIEKFACVSKNASFEVEDEYRLLLVSASYRENNIQFRTVRSTLIPYVPMHIPSLHEFSNGNGPWNAIESIIIGPTANIDLTEKSVRTFFTLRGLAAVKIFRSEVPYRDW